MIVREIAVSIVTASMSGRWRLNAATVLPEQFGFRIIDGDEAPLNELSASQYQWQELIRRPPFGGLLHDGDASASFGDQLYTLPPRGCLCDYRHGNQDGIELP